SVVEIPFGRGGLPNELGEIVPIGLVADATALGREVELIPPGELRLGRQWCPIGLLAADQIAADRNERFTPLVPERGYDVRGARPPAEAGEARPGAVQLR